MKITSELFSLKDEVAVVIGATGVLGGALAEGLAGTGAKVAVLGRNEERGKARAGAKRPRGFVCAANRRRNGLGVQQRLVTQNGS